MLIQTAFFPPILSSIPSAKIIDWIGYKRAIIVGLSTMVAALSVVFTCPPGIPSFPFFLTDWYPRRRHHSSQVAANPYVAVLGQAGNCIQCRLNLIRPSILSHRLCSHFVGARLILGGIRKAAAQKCFQDAVVKLYVYSLLFF